MPTETAVTIRQPATANLMIDSKDRDTTQYPNPFDFQITRTNSIMNGFFTRIGTTEVVLEWCEDNIITDYNDTLVLDISGATNVKTGVSAVLSAGIYTVGDCLDSLILAMNDVATNPAPSTGVTFSIVNKEGFIYIEASGGKFRINTPSKLQSQLGLPTNNAYVSDMLVAECTDLRITRYIDFVSSQLTYNQDLKDNSTATYNRDVLCRWYMAWDDQPTYDQYGFPILMGYKKFVLRRLFNPPKQIRWTNNQPLGNIAFQVYDDKGVLLSGSDPDNWLMTLQFSEN